MDQIENSIFIQFEMFIAEFLYLISFFIEFHSSLIEIQFFSKIF